MKLRAIFVVILCCFFMACDPHPLSRPSNGLRECHKSSALPALEVLPGGGWDNLRNIDMGRVMNLSFSQCQTTEDGVYLIPDEVFVIPQKISGVETNSEMIMSWLEQKSSTSSSINADVSFFSVVNGKFSTENKRMKTHQVKENSVTSRVQVRNHLYTVKAYPDFALDSRFVHQAEEIADAIENNQTRQATYLSERLILDYGTHVITSVDAGATLEQEDYLKKSFISNSQSDMTSISASAGFSFFAKVNFDLDKESKNTPKNNGYQGNVTYSIVQSHGGGLFYHGITLQKWQESTLNNLVAIDRSGLPLHYFLNPMTFSELPKPTITKLALLVYQAAERYYEVNTIPGCINPDSKNFNLQANVDDGSCEGPVTNLSFGGVYQTCTPLTVNGSLICNDKAVKNPATGDFSCPQVYTATLLRSETQESGYYRYECSKKCHSCGFLWLSTCCDQMCGDTYYVHRANIHTYWCSTTQKTPKYSGYLFGGFYGPSLQNPFTKSKSCPANFFIQRFLSNGMMVCLSNDYETGTRFAVPFGGFFSCQSSNPLAEGKSSCPPQFSQHLAAVSDGCQILYCVQSAVFNSGQLKPVRLPPFTNPPLISTIATNTVAVMTEGDRSWVRVGGTRTWRLAKPGEIHQMALTFDRSSQMSGGEKAGVAVSVIALIAFVVAGNAFSEIF
ncbi:macrophage-expressed gene 1 protein-like [Triplophysa rosa]|uniref:Macrophage-expressed gene 1 protein n=1 Tax=Triplophysa rosa TaxID=992332 RepID=A0A9W7WFW8_TRIRA|nr:macrophage-expressed gene 1 protein-like [Triplophysa rosa]KAI7797655.1 macrophage expressed 1 [Triplophysa rosa]